jgi:hypothetical protein
MSSPIHVKEGTFKVQVLQSTVSTPDFPHHKGAR